MKRKTRLALSIVTGLAACVVTALYVSNVRAEAERSQTEMMARYGGELVKVCVATSDIDAGDTIDSANVELTEWVATLLPEDAATSFRDIEGKQATSFIPKNSVVCGEHFASVERGLSVPAGSTAVSLALDDEHAVGGAIEAGCKVDVYVSVDGLADRLCQASVLQTNAETSGVSVPLEWVVLGVDTEHVGEVLAATERGTVSLAISVDKTEKESDGK